jgi:SAM-dependent methyltransferase
VDQTSNSNAAIFGSIYRNKQWGGGPNIDFYSGSGSDPGNIAPYIRGVRGFLAKLGPSIVVDIGCGDFVAGRQIVDLASQYIACDVVEELIERNRRMFIRDNLSFMAADATKDDLPPGDVVIVKQVLQHLSNTQIHNVIQNLRRYKIWIICDHIPIGDFEPNKDIETGWSIRSVINSGIVLTEPPFSIQPTKTEILSELENDPGTPYHGFIRTWAYEFP